MLIITEFGNKALYTNLRNSSVKLCRNMILTIIKKTSKRKFLGSIQILMVFTFVLIFSRRKNKFEHSKNPPPPPKKKKKKKKKRRGKRVVCVCVCVRVSNAKWLYNKDIIIFSPSFYDLIWF